MGQCNRRKRSARVSLFAVSFLAFTVAFGIRADVVSAGDQPSSAIVRDGIDTQSNTREGIDTRSNTREGIDTSGIVKDGIDRRHDDTGITDEGLDRGGLDDDTERPEAPEQPQD